MEQTMIDARASDLDVVGKLKVPLEGATSDTAMEILLALFILLGLAADEKRILLDGDVEILGREARDRHAQAIGVLAGDLDVVRGVRGVDPRRRVGELHQAIEANGGTEK